MEVWLVSHAVFARPVLPSGFCQQEQEGERAVGELGDGTLIWLCGLLAM